MLLLMVGNRPNAAAASCQMGILTHSWYYVICSYSLVLVPAWFGQNALKCRGTPCPLVIVTACCMPLSSSIFKIVNPYFISCNFSSYELLFLWSLSRILFVTKFQGSGGGRCWGSCLLLIGQSVTSWQSSGRNTATCSREKFIIMIVLVFGSGVNVGYSLLTLLKDIITTIWMLTCSVLVFQY